MSRTHGLRATYTNGGCRCDACYAAELSYHETRRARLAADPTLAPHGKQSTYNQWGCRCDACRDAAARRWREYTARRAEWARLRREAAS